MRFPWWWIPVVVVASAFGAWIGRVSSVASPAPAEGLAPTVAPAQNDRVAQEILEELRRLRADVQARPLGSEREVMRPPAQAETSQLVAAITELTTLMRERRANGGGISAFGAELRALVPARGFASLSDLAAASQEDRARPHLFWNLQQVVERYGVPSNMRISDGRLFVCYVFLNGEMTFELSDGIVIAAY